MEDKLRLYCPLFFDKWLIYKKLKIYLHESTVNDKSLLLNILLKNGGQIALILSSIF